MKSKAGLITYVGPVLAGDRLIVAGSNALINVNPIDGSFQSQVDIKTASASSRWCNLRSTSD
jgi:hypothetical protein